MARPRACGSLLVPGTYQYQSLAVAEEGVRYTRVSALLAIRVCEQVELTD